MIGVRKIGEPMLKLLFGASLLFVVSICLSCGKSSGPVEHDPVQEGHDPVKKPDAPPTTTALSGKVSGSPWVASFGRAIQPLGTHDRWVIEIWADEVPKHPTTGKPIPCFLEWYPPKDRRYIKFWIRTLSPSDIDLTQTSGGNAIFSDLSSHAGAPVVGYGTGKIISKSGDESVFDLNLKANDSNFVTGKIPVTDCTIGPW